MQDKKFSGEEQDVLNTSSRECSVVIYLILFYFNYISLAQPRCSQRPRLKTMASIDYYIHPRHDQKRMRFILI